MRPARQTRKIHEAQEEIKTTGLRRDREGAVRSGGTEQNYPDATFTLRLSYGTVRGYEEDGKQIPAFTSFEGLYQRSG